MKKKVILDRSYAFYLIDFISSKEGGSLSEINSDITNEQILKRTIDILNYALVLFDKVLIENSFASSLNHITDKKDWFWDYFSIFSIESLFEDDPELYMLIEDSVALDKKDVKLRKIVKQNFPAQYLQPHLYTSLLWNINHTLYAAKKLDSAIIPWPAKTSIYNYKFTESLKFDENEKSYSFTKSILEFHIPGFNLSHISEMNSIRNKGKSLDSFRRTIWELINSDRMNNENILQTLEIRKAELVKEIKPSWFNLARSLSSTAIPFPFNIGLDALYNIYDIKKIEPFQWYFFLLDLQEEFKNLNN